MTSRITASGARRCSSARPAVAVAAVRTEKPLPGEIVREHGGQARIVVDDQDLFRHAPLSVQIPWPTQSYHRPRPAALLEMLEQLCPLLRRQHVGGVEQRRRRLARGLVERGDAFAAQLLGRGAVDRRRAEEFDYVLTCLAEVPESRPDLIARLVDDVPNLVFLFVRRIEFVEHRADPVFHKAATSHMRAHHVAAHAEIVAARNCKSYPADNRDGRYASDYYSPAPALRSGFAGHQALQVLVLVFHHQSPFPPQHLLQWRKASRAKFRAFWTNVKKCKAGGARRRGSAPLLRPPD